MYVKIMNSYDHRINGENDFSILEVHKGQRIIFWQPPGNGMELQLIENDAVLERHPITGPAYVMNEQGKTIASYGNSLAAMCGEEESRGSGSNGNSKNANYVKD